MKRITIVIVVGIFIGLGLGWLVGSGQVNAQGWNEADPGVITDQESVDQVKLADIGSGFTYQGKLDKNNVPVGGSCDFEFRLYAVAINGAQLGGIDTHLAVPVNNGIFTVVLNDANEFGANAINGAARWLEIRVRCPAGGVGFTILEPRQLLTSTPYATSLQPGAEISGNVPLPNGILNLSNSSGNALRIDSSQNTAISIGSTQSAGLEVTSSNTGVWVQSTEENGVRVVSPGTNGFYVDSATDSGLVVNSAGDDGVKVISPDANGLHVFSAGLYGVLVGSANATGVRVDAADFDGVLGDADLHGVHGRTPSANGEWGLYTEDKAFASGGLSTTALTLLARVDGPDSLQPGDVVTAVGLADPLLDSAASLPLVQLANSSGLENIIGVVQNRMELIPHPGVEEPEKEGYSWRSTPGAAQKGDYVAITVLGVAEVKVDNNANIQPGQRLTLDSTSGMARALRTESLNGMLVSEGSPVIGIALAAPVAGKNTIPVFVTLR